MKVKSVKLTVILMHYRDELKQEAVQLRLSSDQCLQAANQQIASLKAAAKEASHKAIILANQKEKEAQLLQEALNEELELQVKEELASVEAWNPKSEAHLKAEFQGDQLMDLIKKNTTN